MLGVDLGRSCLGVNCSVASYSVCSCLDRNSPGGNCPGWEISRWGEVWAVVVYVRIIRVEDYLLRPISYGIECPRMVNVLW